MVIYLPQAARKKETLRSAHTVNLCFIWIWEQTAIISLYSINWLVFITETECVYCAVRTGPFPLSVPSHIAPYSSLSTCRCHEKGKRTKLGNFPKCKVLSGFGENWMGKCFDFILLPSDSCRICIASCRSLIKISFFSCSARRTAVVRFEKPQNVNLVPMHLAWHLRRQAAFLFKISYQLLTLCSLRCNKRLYQTTCCHHTGSNAA